jgi:hypothetical protein
MDNIFIDGELVDSTESFNNLELQKDYLLEQERASKIEYDLPKIILRYIDTPAVNTFIRCEVIGSVEGAVTMPHSGCVLSIGRDIDSAVIPQVGEIVNIHY